MDNKDLKIIFRVLQNRRSATDVERLISLKEREESNLAICKKRIAKRRSNRLVIIATSVAAVASLFFVVVLLQKPESKPQYKESVAGDSSNVMLLLSDGRKVVVGEQTQVVDKAAAITNDAQKGIIYNQSTDEVVVNTLIVPKGKNHKITFEDGTVVTLNSDSRLTYPSKFVGSTREISLQGEAYFEVSKSDKMFIVQTNGVSIRVYGTIFNINSYHKNSIKTLLVEGSVSMCVSGGEEIHLAPCELGVAERGNVTKKVVSTNKYIAWTSGQFMYEKDDLSQLIEELERWYGVDFVVDDRELEQLKITLIFSREASLEKVVSAIEMLDLKIKIVSKEGRYHISRK